MKKDIVVLAYSGGLDTSVAIKWLQDKYNFEVVAVCIDIGQGKELKPIEKKARNLGCKNVFVIDAKEKFCEEYITPAIKANAMYEGSYPLFTALSRPLISEFLVQVAKEEKAKYIAHGATGKGNDQVRIEVSAWALNPKLKVIAPLREWTFSRIEEIKYAQENNIPVPVDCDNPYSIDLNLYGRSIECGIMEDPWIEPPEDIYTLVKPISQTSDKPTYIEIGFEKGIPASLNKKQMSLCNIITKLNILAGENGIGKIDMMENRLVGIKSRETYEAPAATVIIKTHRDLESLTLSKDILHFKYFVEQKYSELIYNGLWFSNFRFALDAFIEYTQKSVTGDVRIKLFKGNCVVTGRKSPYSLYNLELATYDAGDTFDHKAAEGFIKIWGLPLKSQGGKKFEGIKKQGKGKGKGKE